MTLQVFTKNRFLQTALFMDHDVVNDIIYLLLSPGWQTKTQQARPHFFQIILKYDKDIYCPWWVGESLLTHWVDDSFFYFFFQENLRLLTILRENAWTHFHKIFRIGPTWNKNDYETFGGRLFHAQLECFTFFTLGVAEVCVLGVLLFSSFFRDSDSGPFLVKAASGSVILRWLFICNLMD